MGKRAHADPYQAVEKRDLRRCTSSFVIAEYGVYASFLRIRAPCISSFLTSLSTIVYTNGLIGLDHGAGTQASGTHPNLAVSPVHFGPYLLQVWQPPGFGLVVGMADVMADYRLLAADFTLHAHGFILRNRSNLGEKGIMVEPRGLFKSFFSGGPFALFQTPLAYRESLFHQKRRGHSYGTVRIRFAATGRASGLEQAMTNSEATRQRNRTPSPFEKFGGHVPAFFVPQGSNPFQNAESIARRESGPRPWYGQPPQQFRTYGQEVLPSEACHHFSMKCMGSVVAAGDAYQTRADQYHGITRTGPGPFLHHVP